MLGEYLPMRSLRRTTAFASLAIVLSVTVANPAGAQGMPEPVETGQTPGGIGTLSKEIFGGVGGALAGWGLGSLVTDPESCGEDLSCVLDNLGVTLVAAGTGAAVGSFLAGRLAGYRPSALGAVLGATVGSVLGFGIAKTLEDAGSGPPAAILGFAVSQGTLSALGSHIMGGESR